MTDFQALVLGLVQGLAEFLPISSSAHLALTPWLFGWQDPGLAFDVALHLGTLIALVWYFRADWVALTRAGFAILGKRRVETDEEKRAMYILMATVPAGVAGLLLKDLAENTLRAPWLIASALIAMGTCLWAVDRWAPASKLLGRMTAGQAILIGCAQAFALVPGFSRSGTTITAARALGFGRQAAATFSFLLSLPITVAAVAAKAPEALHDGLTSQLVIGVTAAAVSSWAAIAFLLRYVARRSYGVFATYRWVAGLAVLALWWNRA